MTEIITRMSPVLITGVVVAVFFALQRQNPSVRVRLWLAAWVMMLLRFCIFLLPDNVPPPGLLNNVLSTVAIAALDLAGVLFVVSLTAAVVAERRARAGLILTLSVPVIVYTALEVYNSQNWHAYAVCLGVLFFGGAVWQAVRAPRLTLRPLVIILLLLLVGAVSVAEVLRGNLNFADNAIPTVLFAMAAFFFARLYRRWSPGVVTTVAGFAFWAGIWPAIYFVVQRNMMDLAVSEFWNVPKVFVAFGMVQTLLEDQWYAARAATAGEHALKEQVQRFAEVTSRLLGGTDVKSVCGEIAGVLTSCTTFERAVVLLTDEQRHFYVAGHSGIPPELLAQLREAVGRNTPDVIVEICAQSRQVGVNSFRCGRDKAEGYGSVSGRRRYPPNPYWTDGDELFVPLRSRRGTFVGCLSLDEPRDPSRVTAADLSPLEILATDIAVAVETSDLQRQLLISEKLAGIGQLVAGVTHELNNPLTAVMGYAEVLGDQVQDEEAKKCVGIVRRESLRMKGIIENLLRFARQHKPERTLLDLAPLLEEVVQLRSYETRRKGVEVVTSIDPSLPRILGDETQLRQVLLNVLNNAVDAVEDAPEKKIAIEARAADGKLVVRFMDSGPGFKDLARVFDPFFTTKAIGKGTGLGLSLCYGILKEHGGEIYASNLKPGGACITLEFPLQPAVSSAPAVT
jgi:signal transduction histidine kinase